MPSNVLWVRNDLPAMPVISMLFFMRYMQVERQEHTNSQTLP